MVRKSLHWVRENLPFKYQLFSALKAVWTPPASIYQHLHFHHVINVYSPKAKRAFKINHSGFYMENILFWEGLDVYEEGSMIVWQNLCALGEVRVIMDVGANTGIYGLVAETVNPKAKIYALEPVKRVYAKLADNLNLNHSRVKPEMIAASNKTGETILYDYAGHDFVTSVSLNADFNKNDPQRIETTIQAARLDEFASREGLESYDLLKIDVETFEPEVLEGMGATLENSRPYILFEIINQNAGKRVGDILYPLGYKIFLIDGFKLTEILPDTIGDIVDRNYLAVPSGKLVANVYKNPDSLFGLPVKFLSI